MSPNVPTSPHSQSDETYDPGCTRCPRLASFLAESHAKYPSYWCRPVPSFGADEPSIVIVGLAPGMQGANRTARPFTGDYARRPALPDALRPGPAPPSQPPSATTIR